MAFTSAGNVIRVTSTQQFDRVIRIKAIRFEAGTASSVTIRADNNSGKLVYFADGASDLFEQAEISAKDGIHVTIVADAVVYLYLEDK